MFHLANSTGRAASGCTQRVFKRKALWQNVVSLKTLCVRCSLQLWNIHHHHRHHHQYFTEMHPKNGLSELGLKKGFYLRLTQVVCKSEWLSVLAGRHKRHNAVPVGVFFFFCDLVMVGVSRRHELLCISNFNKFHTSFRTKVKKLQQS